MREAITQAAKAKSRKNLPFGAIVVCDNKIIGTGFSKEIEKNDPTAHAELEAISQACRYKGTMLLQDCSIYASGEPCAMCASAIFHAKIPFVYIAAVRDDLPAVFRRRKIDIFSLARDLSYQPQVVSGILKSKSLELFKDID